MAEAPDLPLPTLYIPHGGGPCFFMDWNPPHTWDKLAAWLGKLGESLGRPKAVVVISGSKIFHDRIMGAAISAFGFGMPANLIS